MAQLQHDSVEWRAAFLPPAPASPRLQRPIAHRHSGVLGLGCQLPAHLAWDSWSIGKGGAGCLGLRVMEDLGQVIL